MTSTDKTAAEFAMQLRALADLYDAESDLPLPGWRLRITPSRATREGYLAVRRLFPAAPVDASDNSSVEVEVEVAGQSVLFSFWKSDIGVQQTVTRDVVEYVLPEAEPVPVVDGSCTKCGRALHDDDPSNTGLGRHVDCTVDGALAGRPA